MQRIRRWIMRAPGWSYLALATGITWALLAPAALSANGLIGWSPPIAWHALGALGPWLAAWLVIAMRDGQPGTRAWLAGQARWRVGWRWLALAALSPLAMLGVALGIGRLLDGRWADAGMLVRAPYGPGWMAINLLIALAYGFGEEPGWRGFLLPHLRAQASPPAAIVLLALAWGGWHGVMFAYRLPSEPLLVAGFFIGLLAGAVWLAWLASRSGSLLVVALWHAVWNIVNIPAMAVSDTVLAALSSQVMIFACLITAGWGWRQYRARRRASVSRSAPY